MGYVLKAMTRAPMEARHTYVAPDCAIGIGARWSGAAHLGGGRDGQGPACAALDGIVRAGERVAFRAAVEGTVGHAPRATAVVGVERGARLRNSRGITVCGAGEARDQL
jgi:hypothetical protein